MVQNVNKAETSENMSYNERIFFWFGGGFNSGNPPPYDYTCVDHCLYLSFSYKVVLTRYICETIVYNRFRRALPITVEEDYCYQRRGHNLYPKQFNQKTSTVRDDVGTPRYAQKKKNHGCLNIIYNNIIYVSTTIKVKVILDSIKIL